MPLIAHHAHGEEIGNYNIVDNCATKRPRARKRRWWRMIVKRSEERMDWPA